MMTGGGDEMGWNDEIHESPNTNSHIYIYIEVIIFFLGGQGVD